MTAASPPNRRSLGELIPQNTDSAEISIGQKRVALTHLKKVFWTSEGITKGDLLRYYADVSPYLLPHLQSRAMVMKRYPNGADGEFFFMKRAPVPRPTWIKTCSIEHASGNVIDFPIVQDLASLLWIVNLGCIDLNPWYGRCPKIDQPDYLHFDLDPMPGVPFGHVLDAALIVRAFLEALGMTPLVKTSGSKGVHIYVGIARGPRQKEVWAFAKRAAFLLADKHPALLTAQYRIEKRPPKRVLVDYNQNAWGRTLASVYSVRPKPQATVSMPITWAEVEEGVRIEDFQMNNALHRLSRTGDLWVSLNDSKNKFSLERVL